MMFKIFLFSSTLLMASASLAKAVRYELTIAKQKYNVTGKEVDFALTVNGGIPAPVLEFNEGDDAEIVVNNTVLDEEVSMHWHGILLPPLEDGVAYVNTPPILPGRSRTFKFRIRQHGTYWYHSHTMVQEQKGVYGALVIHPRTPTVQVDKEAVVVLSDWSDENADQILRNLRKDGDYYLYKKNTVRSIFGAMGAGGFTTYLGNEWSRMGGMDLSDVGYDAFLINGKRDTQLLEAHPGERVRLRIINAGASSYFHVSLGGVPMKVISADGVDIEPTLTSEILMGMAETYDVLFTVPEHKNYELRAAEQGGAGFASAWIGLGAKVPAVTKAAPNLYGSMDHAAHGAGHGAMPIETAKAEGGSHAGHVMPGTATAGVAEVASKPGGPVLPQLTVDAVKAMSPTTLPKNAKVNELKLVLGGDMERYVWHINGKAINEDRDILINEGEVVRFIFENQTMMHHPMHLHGHFFRVLNKYGERSPLKHTVDVPPMGTRTIEFYANEPGQWMLHCHNLYHMKTGMARVVKYVTFKPTAEIAHLEKHDPHLHDHIYQTGSLQLASNIFEGRYKISQTWSELELRVESRRDEDWVGEGDLFYRRWFGNYLNVLAGAAAIDRDVRGQIGVGYTLPLLVRTNLQVDHKGKLRVDVEKRFQWTGSVFSNVEYRWRQDADLGSEFSTSLMYGKSWAWSVGLKLTQHSLGAGFLYQF